MPYLTHCRTMPLLSVGAVNTVAVEYYIAPRRGSLFTGHNTLM